MPSSDPLATQPGDDAPTQPDKPNGTGSPALGTDDDLTQALQQGFAGAIQPFADQLQAVQRELSELRQQRTSQPGDPPVKPSTDVSGLDLAEKFLQDPEGTFKELAGKHDKESIGPYMQRIIPALYETHLATQRVRIDSQYGAGTFEKEFRPRVDELLKQAHETARIDGKAVEHAVSLVRGMDEMQDTLGKARDTFLRSQNDRTDDRAAGGGGILPPGAPRPGEKPTLSQEDREALAKIARVDKDFSERYVLRRREKLGAPTSMTMSDWQSLQEKKDQK